MSLVTSVYKITGGFPEPEKFGLTAQMRRSAVSIPSNIAEGYGRNSTSDYIRFLNIARGSLYELQTQVEIAQNLNFLATETFEQTQSALNEIERMLSALIRSLQKKKK